MRVYLKEMVDKYQIKEKMYIDEWNDVGKYFFYIHFNNSYRFLLKIKKKEYHEKNQSN